MEFRFDISRIVSKPITVFSKDKLLLTRTTYNQFADLLEALGVASARAQGLRSPITTLNKLIASPDHRVYIIREDALYNNQDWSDDNDQMSSNEVTSSSHSNYSSRRGSLWGVRVAGMLKIGTKSLFIMDEIGRSHHVEALCVLDFYVHERYQRKGYGKMLFDYMLKVEGVEAKKLAYDRPSSKMMNFLRKQFGLMEFVPQPTNFVVFKEFGIKLDVSEPSLNNNLRFRVVAQQNQHTMLQQKQREYRQEQESSPAQQRSLAQENTTLISQLPAKPQTPPIARKHSADSGVDMYDKVSSHDRVNLTNALKQALNNLPPENFKSRYQRDILFGPEMGSCKHVGPEVPQHQHQHQHQQHQRPNYPQHESKPVSFLPPITGRYGNYNNNIIAQNYQHDAIPQHRGRFYENTRRKQDDENYVFGQTSYRAFYGSPIQPNMGNRRRYYHD